MRSLKSTDTLTTSSTSVQVSSSRSASWSPCGVVFPSTALDASACPSVRAMVTLKSMIPFPGGRVELSTRDVSAASTGTTMGPKGRSWVGNVRIAHISLVLMAEWRCLLVERDCCISLCSPTHVSRAQDGLDEIGAVLVLCVADNDTVKLVFHCMFSFFESWSLCSSRP